MRPVKSIVLGMMLSLAIIVSGCTSLQAGWADWFGKPITVDSLLGEMASMDHLTRLPDPYYTTAQASSYDRRSKEADDFKTWFANADAGKYIRVEEKGDRSEYVMLDATGPGAVTRIWSANPLGTLRVYIDGAETPAIEATMEEFLSGKVKPFIEPLGHYAAHGYNLYFPIPYAESCKITTDGDADRRLYYQINTRTWPEGTYVKSYSQKQVKKALRKIDNVAAVLADPAGELDTRMKLPKGAETLDFTVKTNTYPISRGFSFEKKGPFQKSKAYQVGKIKIITNGATEENLRKTLMEIDFDGQTHVSAPLGDFFGCGLGLNAYNSLPLSVRENGTLVCRWPMPFRKSMQIRFETASQEPLGMDVRMTLEPIKWTEQTLYFNAFWRADYDQPQPITRDFNFVDLSGEGLYVGNSLNVANHVKNWWGEGDEKIWVDGEDFPSHFGTGSEDYYGYAWCSNELFGHAYHNQPRCDGPGNYGHTAVNRWHIFDPIPFKKSLVFNIEQYAHSPSPLKYDVVNYWYGKTGNSQNLTRVDLGDLRVPTVRELEIRTIPGLIEGEKMNVARNTNGMVQNQDLSGFESEARFWSHSTHLWWMEGKPGDELDLEFDAPKQGDFKVSGFFTKAADYGMHRIAINGQAAPEAIDLYSDRGVVPSGPVDLGVFALREGKNTMTITIEGTNAQANPKRYMFGLDGITLDKQ